MYYWSTRSVHTKYVQLEEFEDKDKPVQPSLQSMP